jgi:hypothetical protein
MHRPGYVQGGQEAGFGYLLLGVYHRRIPGATVGGITLPTEDAESCGFFYSKDLRLERKLKF